MRRVIYVVLDGVGVGELPDAPDYGDVGSDTLGNLSRVHGLRMPFLERLGLGDIAPLMGIAPTANPLALVGRLAPLSVGKDSTVGHWEQMGLVTADAFPTYPEGFPPEIVQEFSRGIGREVLGNRPASGTEIIAELGDEHVASGSPIIYTSVDSVFQIAAHTAVVPLEMLYSWCHIARALLTGQHGVARVIARPFVGVSGAYERTPDRRDFSLPPPGPTYLDELARFGVHVHALGKIAELFAGRGVSTSVKVSSNHENLALLRDIVRGRGPLSGFDAGLVITNLMDFDTAWGHRNDVEGFARGLEVADAALARIADAMSDEDVMLITADHGVDPTTPGTDHSREYVPMLLYPRPSGSKNAVYEGYFADAGATAFEYLTGLEAGLQGRSLLRDEPARGFRSLTQRQGVGTGTVAGEPGRVGDREAKTAGLWLTGRFGEPPELAVVLGSGLSLDCLGDEGQAVAYDAVPEWRVGKVEGHANKIAIRAIDGRRIAVLSGRIHEYEGFDLSEVQLPIRSLAAWAVHKVVLTSAGGAVGAGLAAGDVVVVDKVVDLQYRDPSGRPVLLDATPADAIAALRARSADAGVTLLVGSHASVPGPQYETAAELELLQSMGAATVSMTPAGELRAAYDEGMQAVVLTVVTNAGETTHSDVLVAAQHAGSSLARLVTTLSAEWA